MKFSIVEGGLIVLGCELGSFRGLMMSGMVDSFLVHLFLFFGISGCL